MVPNPTNTSAMQLIHKTQENHRRGGKKTVRARGQKCLYLQSFPQTLQGKCPYESQKYDFLNKTNIMITPLVMATLMGRVHIVLLLHEDLQIVKAAHRSRIVSFRNKLSHRLSNPSLSCLNICTNEQYNCTQQVLYMNERERERKAKRERQLEGDRKMQTGNIWRKRKLAEVELE